MILSLLNLGRVSSEGRFVPLNGISSLPGVLFLHDRSEPLVLLQIMVVVSSAIIEVLLGLYCSTDALSILHLTNIF